MAISLPHSSFHFSFSRHPPAIARRPSTPCLLKPRLQRTFCSSSVQEPSVVDKPASSSSYEEASIVADSDVTNEEEKLRLSGCKACGRAEIEKGCNGEGRIQGGIATVPGFGWWPIKAFRPCPGFVASGGRYRRRGQSMDEVAFGRGGPEASSSSMDKDQSSKKAKSAGRSRG